MVRRLGDRTDEPALAAVLEQADLGALFAVADPNALVRALCTQLGSGFRLPQQCRLLGLRVGALIHDDIVPVPVRAGVLRLFCSGEARHYGVQQPIAELLARPDLPLELSCAAAMVLIDADDAYVPLVRAASAGWPAEASEHIDYVRSRLARSLSTGP